MRDYPLTQLNIGNVELTDSFWLPLIERIQDSTIPYAFNKCRQEGRMENFLIAGKVRKGPVRGKMPFDDTDLYKIIEGASWSLVSLPNPALDAYLDSVIAIIETGQEPDGYLTTWFSIDRQHPPAPWVKPSTERWENEISSHELYNSGHLFEAAAAHYEATGKRSLLNIALKNADLLVENFRPDKHHIPPGHQIVETGLIKLYRITGKTGYLELARYFLDLRGDSTSHKLYGEYNQDHKPVTLQTEAVGHAVRAEYMYAGMTDIAAIYGDTAYRDAVSALWENIINHKMYLTGGVGSRHEGEAFGANDELPNLTAYNETCAAIGSVLWNQRMFLLSGDSRYNDILERTLYNGLISGISAGGKEFFYPNPLESDGHYAFNMGACTRQPWFDCSCCPTNLIRFLPSLPRLIYATTQNELYVNLYVSNHAKVRIRQQDVGIIQQTAYPWSGNVVVTVNPGRKMNFTLKLRVPGWAMGRPVPGDLYTYDTLPSLGVHLRINGKEEKITFQKGYATITRAWKQGDTVELELPMQVNRVIANARVKEDAGKMAFEYGPFVYCAEETDGEEQMDQQVPRNISLDARPSRLLSQNVNILVGKAGGKEWKLVPYFLWSNRGTGKMKVWFEEAGK